MYLAQKLTRGLGSSNIDARLRQSDFRDDEGDPRFPSLGSSVATLGHADAILLVGSRSDQGSADTRSPPAPRGATGAAVLAINPRRYDLCDAARRPIMLFIPMCLLAALAALTRKYAGTGPGARAGFPRSLSPTEDAPVTDEMDRQTARSRRSTPASCFWVSCAPASGLRRSAPSRAALADLAEGSVGLCQRRRQHRRRLSCPARCRIAVRAACRWQPA